MKLIIQIPCYNEAETLEIALNDLPKHIDGVDEIEYLIVDDGSTDKTVEVAVNWGVHHVMQFTRNKGLARGFMAGLEASLSYGADIIVNTDADNQYCGEDIELLVKPILEGRADIVIGERPIDSIEHFSWIKKKMQHFGSWVVRKASRTDIPDAPSGFRAFSRDAAMHINVVNEYTYTLETIVQAGRNKMSIISVPVRTNPELRKSRLFHSIGGYIKKSALTIVRALLMYRPLAVLTLIGSIPFLVGLGIGIRFIVYIFQGRSAGHVQSLILACTLMIIGFMTFVIGMLADVISANRKIIEDVQYHVRRLAFDKEASEGKDEKIEELRQKLKDTETQAEDPGKKEGKKDDPSGKRGKK